MLVAFAPTLSDPFSPLSSASNWWGEGLPVAKQHHVNSSVSGGSLNGSKSFLSKNDSEVNSLAGQAVGGINAVEPAKKIVDDMVSEACGGPKTFWTNQKSE